MFFLQSITLMKIENIKREYPIKNIMGFFCLALLSSAFRNVPDNPLLRNVVNDQTHFKNLTAFPARYLECV